MTASIWFSNRLGRVSRLSAAYSKSEKLSGKTYQLLQIRIGDQTPAIPELSANRHMLWLRFTIQDGDLRPRAFEGNVEFEMTLCNF